MGKIILRLINLRFLLIIPVVVVVVVVVIVINHYRGLLFTYKLRTADITKSVINTDHSHIYIYITTYLLSTNCIGE